MREVDGSAFRQLAWYLVWTLLVSLGLLLGLWQWERGHDKRQYLAELEAAPRLEAPQQTPAEGSRIVLRGRYLAEHTRFLDNRVVDGRVGVAALTPFEGEDGRLWLIQRGFLPTGPARSDPVLETPSGTVSLEGRWQAAQPARLLFGPNEEGRRLQHIALEAWQPMGEFAHAGWLHQERGAGMLEAWWRPSAMPPSRHFGYAVQWWGLALAALVVMVLGGRRLRLDAAEAQAGRRGGA